MYVSPAVGVGRSQLRNTELGRATAYIDQACCWSRRFYLMPQGCSLQPQPREMAHEANSQDLAFLAYSARLCRDAGSTLPPSTTLSSTAPHPCIPSTRAFTQGP